MRPGPRILGGSEGLPRGRPGLQRAADAVTLSRVALLPFFLWTAEAVRAAAAVGESGPRGTALGLMLAMGLSDKLDGFLARRSGGPPTRRGAFLDAAADRVVTWVGVGYLTLRANAGFTAVPLWLAITVAARDGVLLAAWAGRRSRAPVPLEHERHGKVTTAGMFLLLVASVAGAPTPLVNLTAIAVALTLAYSTARYARRLVAPGADTGGAGGG